MPDTVSWVGGLGLATDEQVILQSLFETGQGVDVARGLGPEDLWSGLTTCARAYLSSKRAQNLLKPILGKLLVALENFPELYQRQGYRTFDAFLSDGMPKLFGLPRSESYRAKRLASTWPSLTPQECAEIGDGKLYILSKITNSSDPASPGWLDVARTSTTDQLRDEIVKAGEATREELIPVQVSFTTTLDLKTGLKEFWEDPRAQSIVGTADYGSMLMAAVAEFRATHGI